ncbi:MAG: arginase family protein [Candidatus Aenigmatarchaeota archaeon]
MSGILYLKGSFTTMYPLEEADVCFVGIPFDSTALAEGNQRFGPVTVREALKTSQGNVPEKNTNPLKELKVAELGDLEWVPGDFKETAERIKDTVDEIQERNEEIFPVFLGGEHTISLPLIKAMGPKMVVQLDAHADLEEDYQGNKYAHDTWAYHLLEKTDVELVQVGVRSFAEDKRELVRSMKKPLKNAEGLVYLTVDMDVFDPRYAPDVGYPEENGMEPREVFEIIDEVFEKEVVGMDVCEVASKELNNRTSVLASKTILRALSNLC